MAFGKMGARGGFGSLGGLGTASDLPDAALPVIRSAITGLNHGNVNQYFSAAPVAQLPNGDWSVGVFFRRTNNNPLGYILGFAPLGATVAQCTTGNNTLAIYETGTGATAQFANRLAVFGRDQSGNSLGGTAVTLDGHSVNCILSEQLESNLSAVYLAVVRRRASSGITELVLCAKGQRPRVAASLVATWTGFSVPAVLSVGGRAAANGTAVTGNDLDSPFLFTDYALTDSDIERVANGENPELMNSSGRASAQIAFASMVYQGVGQYDLVTDVNPSNGQTITLNGDVWTFVTSGATGNQVNIGASLSATLDSLVTALNALTPNSGGASNATYSKYGTNTLRIQSRTAGGTSFTFDTNASSAKMPRSKRLAQVEAMYVTDTVGSGSGGTFLSAYLGGVPLGRSILATTWTLVASEMAYVTPRASAVRLAPWDAGMICQHNGGSATLSLSGSFVGNPPSNVQIQVIDISNSSVVLAWTSLSSFSVNRSAKTWSGKLVGVPKGKRWLGFQTRKIGKSETVASEVPWGVGEIVLLNGQSLQVAMASGAGAVTPNGYASKLAAANANKGDNQNGAPWWSDSAFHRLGSSSANIGAGEGAMLNLLSNGLNCVVSVVNLSLGGSNVATLNAQAYWDAFNANLAKTFTDPTSGPLAAYFCWDQGHADPGTGYGAKLDSLYAALRTNLGSQIKFVLNTLSNIQAANTSDNTLLHWQTIQEQRQWLDGKAADSLVIFGGDTDDYTSNTTDGTHPSSSADYQRKAERIALSILKDRGAISFDGGGPRIASVSRSGAVLTVNVAHNGGANLQSRAGSGDVTGFDVSANNFSSLLTISSAQITGASQITLTLSADPGGPVSVNYLWGRPGKIAADPVLALDPSGRSAATQLTSTAQSNPVYDDRAGLTYNTGGLPLQFTAAPVVSN